MVKQISAFIENKPARLTEATRVIGDADLNIRALPVADTWCPDTNHGEIGKGHEN